MNRRGFALISVVLLTAMVAVAGAVLLDMVRLDILLGRSQRQTVTSFPCRVSNCFSVRIFQRWKPC